MNYFLLATFYLIHFYYDAYVNRRFKRSPYATFYLIHFYYDAYVNRSIQKVTRMQHFATSFFFIFHQHVHICMSLTFQASTASEKMLACKMCFEIPPYQNSNSKFDRRHSLKSRNSECLFSRNRSIVTIKYKKVYKKIIRIFYKKQEVQVASAYQVYFLYLIALMITKEGIKKFGRSNLSNLQFNFVSAISC